MCGRFTLNLDLHELREAFPDYAVPEDFIPRYNIAPTQPVAVIPNDGRSSARFFRWGLIPPWASDPKIGNRLINARAESVAEKPAFRAAYKRRRCLILADGFYEWQTVAGGKSKTPMYIRLKSGGPFAFAGLWETWRSPNGQSIPSCAIITTEPNSLLKSIHNRMPVILEANDYDQWLDSEEQNPERLGKLLRPYPASLMSAYAVSTAVNNPSFESPDCIRPV